MTNNNTTSIDHPFRYGLYISAASIILMLITYIFNQYNSLFFGVLGWLVILIGLFISAYKFREEKLNGFISYGTSFRIIFLTALFFGLIMTVYTMLHFGVMDPEGLDQMMYEEQKKLAESGKITQEQFDSLKNIQENITFTWWGM
ncbi:MAG: DUF4199 domain-containing protein [Bacteroidales bacterium]|nr:DUF4199 domain-containing protein [Bacteroidales bacterium]